MFSRGFGRVWTVRMFRSPSLLSKLRHGRQRKLLRPLHRRRPGEGRIQPRPQIAVGEELELQQGHQIRQRPAKRGSELEIFEDQERDQRRPDLGVQRIGAGPDEGLHLEVLFQGLEQEFDLPAVAVDLGNRRRPKGQVVGEEGHGVLGLRVQDLDPAEDVRALLDRAYPAQLDQFVCDDASVRRDLAGPDYRVDSVGLQSGDEEDPLMGQRSEPGVVHVAPVDDQDGPGSERQGLRHRHLVPRAFGDQGIRGQVALMVEQEMELHRPLRPAEGGPVKERGAEIDDGGVQAQQRVLEPEPASSFRHGVAAPEQVEEDLLVQPPRSVCVPRRPRWSAAGP